MTNQTTQQEPAFCTAFAGVRRIGSGELTRVVLAAKAAIDGGSDAPVMIFDDANGAVIEVDYRGTADDVLRRLSAGKAEEVKRVLAPQGPGRPRLGVVAREVTLLPRHWDWLNSQPGGASVALRKLVEEARRDSSGRDRIRQAQEACYRFLSTMAGDRPGFEEATRALFAGSAARFDEHSAAWPGDIRDYARQLADGALA